jgi:plasmid stabilization system protein ParE
MAFRVEYRSQAEADLDSILEWPVSQHAGEAGLRWFEGLEEAIASLSEMPHRCALAPENRSFPFEVQHLLDGRKPHAYRVLFRVIDDVVYILHIWHGRRQLLKH